MSTINQLFEGLVILKEYENESEHVYAEHDMIYVGETRPEDMKPEHVQQLEELHWHFNDEYECWCKFC